MKQLVDSEKYLFSIAECKDGEEDLKSFFIFCWGRGGCVGIVLGSPGKTLRKQTN